MSGSVAYSTPAGGTAETGTFPGCAGATQTELQADPDCLVLEVRDVQAVPKARYAVNQYGTFTLRDALTGNSLKFSSTVDSVFDVVVLNHPTGRVCLVGDAGAVSLYRTGTFNPVDITAFAAAGAAANTRAWGTRLNVFCRLRPPWQSIGRPTGDEMGMDPHTHDQRSRPRRNRHLRQLRHLEAQRRQQRLLTFYPAGTFLFGTHARLTRRCLIGCEPAGYRHRSSMGFYDYSIPMQSRHSQ